MPAKPTRRSFLTAVVCVLALAVVFASTQARLSQYKPVVAPTGTLAKTVKLAECRFQKQLMPPLECPEMPVIEPSCEPVPAFGADTVVPFHPPKPPLALRI